MRALSVMTRWVWSSHTWKKLVDAIDQGGASTIVPMLSTTRARWSRILDHVAYPSAERRETHPSIQRYDPCAWGQDLDGIEVEILQFGDALH